MARARGWIAAHPRRTAAAGAALVALALYPWVGGAVAAHLVASRASERLGRAVTVERGRAGLGKLTLTGLKVAGVGGGPTLFQADSVAVPFGVAFGGKGPVRLRGARAFVVRGATGDNVSSILQRLRGRGPEDGDRDDAGRKHRALP